MLCEIVAIPQMKYNPNPTQFRKTRAKIFANSKKIQTYTFNEQLFFSEDNMCITQNLVVIS